MSRFGASFVKATSNRLELAHELGSSWLTQMRAQGRDSNYCTREMQFVRKRQELCFGVGPMATGGIEKVENSELLQKISSSRLTSQ